MSKAIKDICAEYTEEDYIELCEIADYWGIYALTEDQQIAVQNYHKFIEEDK